MTDFEIGDTVRFTTDIWEPRRTPRGAEIQVAAKGDTGTANDVVSLNGAVLGYGVIVQTTRNEITLYVDVEWVEAYD